MHARTLLLTVAALTGLSLGACRKEAPEAASPTPTPDAAAAPAADTIRATAKDAYLFGYPLVLMDASRAKMTNVPDAASHPGVAPVNQFAHMKRFPDATFTDVVSPNADTLYSIAWLDVGKEPIVLSVPDTKERYYLMPMLDGWTNVFTAPGKRTTGTGKGNFAVTGPGWTGTLPEGVQEVKAPTSMVWLVGRTQTNGAADFAAVNALQAQYTLVPLSAWGKPYTPPTGLPVDASIDMKAAPVDVTAKLDASAFFSKLAALMKDNPPAAADAPMVEKLATIGVVPGQAFDINKLGPEAAKAIAAGVDEAKQGMVDLGHHLDNGKDINGWQVMLHDVGSYGTNYKTRAGIAWVGLGANLTDDAIYPMARTDGEGQPLTGADKYVIHFNKDQTPPANAFWSLTMYNAKQAFVANPLNRYAIGDRDKLKYNSDGSLDIYVQRESPGKDKESNWLPADAGPFNIAMRIYWPKESVTSGAWAPPPIKKVAP